MRQAEDRLARNQDPGQRPDRRKRRGISLRLAVALIAFAALLAADTAGISAAEAATGGLSGESAAVAEEAETGEGGFSGFHTAGASWYGPGLYGRKTACGETLRKNTIGVAHRSLPCGTTVKFVYHGHALVTQVIDRGPYVHGRSWDLTQAASEALELEGVGQVRYAVSLVPAPQGVTP
jgi:rare lipoprotein A (peptidoglycan hydrolase)